MLALFAAKVTPHLPTNTVVHNFGQRLVSNDARLAWSLILGVIVLLAVRREKELPARKFLAILAGFGSAGAVWYIFNSVMGESTPLFVGSAQPANVFDLFTQSGWGFLAGLVGLLLGVIVFVTTGGKGPDKPHLVIRVLAGFGTWFAVTLLYTLVFVQWGLLAYLQKKL